MCARIQAGSGIVNSRTGAKKSLRSESGLWGITFGGGTSQNGKKNQLFFAAGPDKEKAGLCGAIRYKK